VSLADLYYWGFWARLDEQVLIHKRIGNAGLGKEAALQLAKHNPSRILIGSRSEEKARNAIAEIVESVPGARLMPIQMDLASLASVKEAANKVLTTTPRLDILMNNAGIMAVPPATTVDDYEIQFGTNYMGHALLTNLLLPLLVKTAEQPQPGSDVRIVTLTSHSHTRAPKGGIDFPRLRSAGPESSPLTKYGVSKLANILHVKQLAKRYPTIIAVAIHPGMVDTNLSTTMKQSFGLAQILMPIVSYFSAVGIEQGVLNQLWGATSAEAESGQYYEPVGVGGNGSRSTDDVELAEKLWSWTEEELAGWGKQVTL
jgi:NAD(P)-dependent dehydrogenase (short-subunit alcohol dehydrogenase family)